MDSSTLCPPSTCKSSQSWRKWHLSFLQRRKPPVLKPCLVEFSEAIFLPLSVIGPDLSGRQVALYCLYAGSCLRSLSNHTMSPSLCTGLFGTGNRVLLFPGEGNALLRCVYLRSVLMILSDYVFARGCQCRLGIPSPSGRPADVRCGSRCTALHRRVHPQR